MQQSRSISEDLEPFRSKLYLLNGDNGWLDQGTGYPIIVEEPTGSMLKFAREDSGNVVYQVTLTDELQFEQQDEKIFTWYNKRTNVDMALSFQNGGGSDKIWQKINEIVANKRAYFGPFAQAENMDELISTPHEAEMGYEEPKLTEPNENNLGRFEQDLMNWSMAGVERKNALCHLLCGRKSYIAGLIEAFRKSEDAKSKENLTSLFRIFRQMINLAHYELYSILLSDEYYLDVFGALEYDPEREGGKNSITHRKYFQEHVKFNQVGTIKDPNILRLIHWNFRLMYLRDCVLAHYLDERILQFISAIVHSNYIDILKYVHSSREVLSSLFDSLRSRKLTALKMIHEMCLIMKNLDVDKVAIFEVFAEYNIFETFEEIMIRPTTQASLTKMGKKDNKKGKDNATDEINVKSHLHMILEVLMLSLVQAPHCLRDYCISQPQKVQKYPLLSYIVEQVTNHEDSIIQNMLGEVVKHLIDASEPDENPLQGLFYEKFLIKLIEVFDKPSTEEKIKNAKSVVLDLLIYCAKQQMPQLTKYIVPLDIPGRIFKNFEANDKFLILVIIQLYKLLLLIREPEVVNSLCKQLDHIIDYFLKYCKNKSNLLHSSLLEVFVLIIKEEIFLLLTYIVEKHKAFMQDPACTFITNKLKEKYRKLTTGETEGMVEEQKQNSYPFNLNARKGKASLTIISPFGSVLAVNNSENSRKMGPTSLGVPSIENSPSPVQAKSEGGSPPQILSPSKGGEERPDMRRTSSNLAKLVDYDDEMEFNMETRGKDVNFMLEDIQLKKRKIDELNNSVTVINK